MKQLRCEMYNRHLNQVKGVTIPVVTLYKGSICIPQVHMDILKVHFWIGDIYY